MVVRTILKFNLLQACRRRHVTFDTRRHAPGLDDTVLGTPHWPHQQERTVKSWTAIFNGYDGIRFGDQGLIHQIDIEPKPDAAAFCGTAGRNLIGIAVAVSGDEAIA